MSADEEGKGEEHGSPWSSKEHPWRAAVLRGAPHVWDPGSLREAPWLVQCTLQCRRVTGANNRTTSSYYIEARRPVIVTAAPMRIVTGPVNDSIELPQSQGHTSNSYDQMRSAVMAWARRKRVQAMERDDPVEISGVMEGYGG